MHKRRWMWLLIIAVFIVIVVLFAIRTERPHFCQLLPPRHEWYQEELPSAEGVFLRTDRSIYDEESWGKMVGMLINLSPDTLTIEDSSIYVYQLRNLGLGPPKGTEGTTLRGYMGVVAESLDSNVTSGSAQSIEMIWYQTLVDTFDLKWLVLGLTYFEDEREYVIYSNRIGYVDSTLTPSQSEPPNTLRVGIDLDAPYLLSFTNDANEIIWFNPICSDFPISSSYFRLGVTTLERYSGYGTWEVIRPDRQRCTEIISPIRIDPCRRVSVALSDGYPSWEELSPGTYRWNVVYYAEANSTFLDHALSGYYERHLFTKTFQR
jgi:hypothetical protein